MACKHKSNACKKHNKNNVWITRIPYILAILLYRHFETGMLTITGLNALEGLTLTWRDMQLSLCVVMGFVIPDNSRQLLDWPGGTRWHSWLRRCVTRLKAAGSIADEITGISHWVIPSGRYKALRSTQPPTEMSTKSISWREKAVGA
jgi:hypothetical protein